MSRDEAKKWLCCKYCDRMNGGKWRGLSRWRRSRMKRNTRKEIEQSKD